MLTHSRTRTRLNWWVEAALIALAFALAAAFARTAGGQMPAERIPTAGLDQRVDRMAWAEAPADFETAESLVRIIDLYEAGRWAEADKAWDGVNLPVNMAAWKPISQGASAMRATDWKAAHRHFERAVRLERNNPVAHYMRGVLAVRANMKDRERFDDAGPNVEHYVVKVDVRDAVPPRRKANPAVAHFKRALDLAPVRNAERSLLNAPWAAPSPHSMAMPIVVPTVADLMEALGVTNWEGDAHYELGAAMLAEGELADAERHWDEAADRGLNVRREFHELSRRHKAAGRIMDAMRCKLKAVQFGGPYLGDAYAT